MIRRLLERVTPRGRREARELRARAARIASTVERQRRVDGIYRRFCA